MRPTIIEIRQAFRELEREGRLVKTGEYRRSRQGILEPVYVTREIYEQHEQMKGRAGKTAEVRAKAKAKE